VRTLIRADASARIGIGHVVRCFALAEELIARGEEVTLAAASLPEPLRETLLAAGARVERVDALPGSPEDGARTTEFAEAMNAHWIVLDGYQFGPSFQSALRLGSCRLLVVDDAGHAAIPEADVVLNQNAYAESGMYLDLAAATRLLLGTRYALLRRQFTAARPSHRAASPEASRILVTLGGGDALETTRCLLDALTRTLPASAEVVVVTGPASGAGDSLREVIGRAPFSVRVEHDVANMAAVMSWADMSVSGGGATCLELAFMGIPNCIVTMADNQREVARAFDSVGAAVDLGEWDAREDHAQRVAALAADRERRAEMSSRGRTLVDGRGAGRVAAIMQAALLRLRPAVSEDEELLWRWRNDPEVRAWSFGTEPIPRDEHGRWFRSALAGQDIVQWICLDGDGTPIGQGRIRIDGTKGEISVSLAAPWRRRGYGRVLVELVTDQYLAGDRAGSSVTALIKVGNEGSKRVFEGAGYVLSGRLDVAGVPAWRYVRRRASEAR
jgi:UDP-2,4-diacetamido-2,4,6-trideoxy-beta-L-altropyranose hydrolase